MLSWWEVGWVSLCWTHQYNVELAWLSLSPLFFQNSANPTWDLKESGFGSDFKKNWRTPNNNVFVTKKKKKEVTWQTMFIALLFNYLYCYSHACKSSTCVSGNRYCYSFRITKMPSPNTKNSNSYDLLFWSILNEVILWAVLERTDFRFWKSQNSHVTNHIMNR